MRGPAKWECIGVHRCGQRLSDQRAQWCPRCHGGPFCLEALEGHLAGHREIDEEREK